MKHDRAINVLQRPQWTDGEPVIDRCASGVHLTSTWGGKFAYPSAKITEKFGSSSFDHLIRRARTPLNLVAATVPGVPLYFGRVTAAAIMEHKLFRPYKVEHDDGSVTIEHVLRVRHNERLLPHIGFRCWFGDDYPWRWDQAASHYLDVRVDGKATNSADLTSSQAAARLADEALANLSTWQYTHKGPRCPLIFYEKPILCFFLLWLIVGLNVALNILDREFWLGLFEEPASQGEAEWRYIPSNIYKEATTDGWLTNAYGEAPSGKLASLDELLSAESPKLDRLYREWFREVAKSIKRPVAPTERDKTIADHWPLVAKKCRIVPKAHRPDAIQQCMERLVKVWDDWIPELGTFGTFAAPAIDRELRDFMRQLRRQVPVQRSINVPADNASDGEPQPERPDVMKLNTLEKQVAASQRRLVGERLGCLDLRERQVIEGLLALNGYRQPVSHKALAAELGMHERTIRRIESMAVEKLRGAVT